MTNNFIKNIKKDLINWKKIQKFKNNNEYYFIYFKELTKLPLFILILGKLNMFIFSSFSLPLFFEFLSKEITTIVFVSISIFISILISLTTWTFNYYDRIIDFYLFCKKNKLIKRDNKINNEKFIKVINNNDILKEYCIVKKTTTKTKLLYLFIFSFPLWYFLTAVVISF